MSNIICNFSSICVDCDCKFKHYPESITDRKVIRKLYNGLVTPNKSESNPHTRKANCRNGQICFNSDCGFRHRLSFSNRMVLVNGFNDAKRELMTKEKIETVPTVNDFQINTKNRFDCLENDDQLVVNTKPSYRLMI